MNSGENSQLESIDQLKNRFILFFSLLAIIVLFIFGVNAFSLNEIIRGSLQLVAAGVLASNLIIFSHLKNYSSASKIIIFVVLIILLYIFSDGGIENTAIFWTFSLPGLVFFLRGRKEGLIWLAIFSFALIMVQFLAVAGVINQIYSWITIRQLFASLATASLLIYFFELITEEIQQSQINLAQELSEKNRLLNEQITQKRESEEDLVINVQELEQTKTAMLNVLEDLGEEKHQAEKLSKDLLKFQKAVENANDQIVITNNEGLIIYANPALEKITGFKSSDVIGKKAGVKDLWGGLEDKDFYKNLWHTIKDKKETFTGKIKNKRKDKTTYDAQISISPILNDKGDVEFFVSIERDITKEQEIDRAKTEFVSLASHQLKTPLSAINWFTELLLSPESGKLSKEQTSYAEEISEGSRRMVELVNALLNVSRLELGTFMVEPQPINLLSLLRSILDEVKPEIDEKNLTVKETHDQLEKLNLDPKLTRIILQNLITNAIKYTPAEGKIDINLKKVAKNEPVTESKTAPQDVILIKIADNGFGIPKDQQDKIFTKLFRADNVRAKDTDGTGLGLYLTKSIVEHVSGEIWFESTKDKGTTFYVTIPAKGMASKEGTKSLNIGHKNGNAISEPKSELKKSTKKAKKKKSTSKKK